MSLAPHVSIPETISPFVSYYVEDSNMVEVVVKTK